MSKCLLRIFCLPCIFMSVMYIFINREYVVDLVGEPGNLYGPDSSVNGALLSPMPSLFQISHLKEFQQPYMDSASCCQSVNTKPTCVPTGIITHTLKSCSIFSC